MGKDKGKSHQKKMEIRVDFTPMVDMNMLLLTFFMLCTTMIKSQTLQIALPSNEKVDKEDASQIRNSDAITIILDSEREDNVAEGFTKGAVKSEHIYYYLGMPTDEKGNIIADLKKVEYDKTTKTALELRKVLQDKNKDVLVKINKLKKQLKSGALDEEAYKERAKKVRNDSLIENRPAIRIKATDNASYENLINILDEMQINQISRYQIEDLDSIDCVMLKRVGIDAEPQIK